MSEKFKHQRKELPLGVKSTLARDIIDDMVYGLREYNYKDLRVSYITGCKGDSHYLFSYGIVMDFHEYYRTFVNGDGEVVLIFDSHTSPEFRVGGTLYEDVLTNHYVAVDGVKQRVEWLTLVHIGKCLRDWTELKMKKFRRPGVNRSKLLLKENVLCHTFGESSKRLDYPEWPSYYEERDAHRYFNESKWIRNATPEDVRKRHEKLLKETIPGIYAKAAHTTTDFNHAFALADILLGEDPKYIADTYGPTIYAELTDSNECIDPFTSALQDRYREERAALDEACQKDLVAIDNERLKKIAEMTREINAQYVEMQEKRAHKLDQDREALVKSYTDRGIDVF